MKFQVVYEDQNIGHYVVEEVEASGWDEAEALAGARLKELVNAGELNRQLAYVGSISLK